MSDTVPPPGEAGVIAAGYFAGLPCTITVEGVTWVEAEDVDRRMTEEAVKAVGMIKEAFADSPEQMAELCAPFLASIAKCNAKHGWSY